MYLHMYRSEYGIEQNVDCVLQLNDTFTKPLPMLRPRSRAEQFEHGLRQLNDAFNKPLPNFALRFGAGQNENELSQLNDPCTGPLPTLRPRPETIQRRPTYGIRRRHVSRCWQQIMYRNAKELDYLPVPPKDCVSRERKAMKARSKKQSDAERYEVKLRHLLREERPRQLPSERDNECWRWMLQPMTEKQPEPKPGVPRVTVTDPGGKTWWLKDVNTYITIEQEATISARVIKEHRGRDNEDHCAAFQEAYRKGLYNKPKGMRPEILYCVDCRMKQAKIEEEEARIVDEDAHDSRVVERADIEDYEASVETARCVLDVVGLARLQNK